MTSSEVKLVMEATLPFIIGAILCIFAIFGVGELLKEAKVALTKSIKA